MNSIHANINIFFNLKFLFPQSVTYLNNKLVSDETFYKMLLLGRQKPTTEDTSTVSTSIVV